MSAGPTAKCLFRFDYLVGHADTDDAGVVHFARYPALIETAVLAGLDAIGAGLTAMRDQGCDFAVTELRMRYNTPAAFLDRLEISACTEHVGYAQVRMAGAVRRNCGPDSEPIASAQLVLGAIGLESRSASRLPSVVRTALLATR